MKKGFTLVEVIIYIALFSLLLGTAFVTAFQLIQGTDILNAKKVNQEEINFVLKKIDWALGGVSSIDNPSSLVPYSNRLVVTKYGGNTIDICLDEYKIKIKETNGFWLWESCANSKFLPLTTDNVKVTSLQFRYIAPIGGAPAGIVATTTINGFVATTTKYIRK